MARTHDDGWGHAWLDRHDVVRVERFAQSGLHDPGLSRALTSCEARAHLVHLRLATNGMPRNIVNTHPFAADGFAFAHNGSLPIGPMRELIRDDCLRDMTGTTDSERYFAVIRSRIRELGDVETAVLTAVRQLRDINPRRSLNAMLLTPDSLVVIHASRGVPIPWKEFTSREALGSLPAAHDERYYRMHVRRRGDGSLVVASSGMDVSGWAELPDESVTTIDLASLSLTTVPIG